MIFVRPAFVACAVAIYFMGVYFPWATIAEWTVLRAFSWTMTQIVPSIEGLPPEARHLPRRASLLQMSVLHFACGAFFLWRVITLKPAVWLLQPSWRFVLVAGACLVGTCPPIYWIFFWQGGISETGFQSIHKLVVIIFIIWFVLTNFVSLGLSSLYELIRRRRYGYV